MLNSSSSSACSAVCLPRLVVLSAVKADADKFVTCVGSLSFASFLPSLSLSLSTLRLLRQSRNVVVTAICCRAGALPKTSHMRCRLTHREGRDPEGLEGGAGVNVARMNTTESWSEGRARLGVFRATMGRKSTQLSPSFTPILGTVHARLGFVSCI